MINHYQPSHTDTDLLPVVDEADNVIGAAPRREVHLQGLRHRAVHAVVINAAEQVLLQRRSHRKDSHPGYWDISMGGHVDVDEHYSEAVVRELGEELGISASPKEVARRSPAVENGWEFVRIYEVAFEGPFEHNTDEIDELRWVPVAELFAEYDPKHTDPERRITGSGLESITLWAKATGRLR